MQRFLPELAHYHAHGIICAALEHANLLWRAHVTRTQRPTPNCAFRCEWSIGTVYHRTDLAIEPRTSATWVVASFSVQTRRPPRCTLWLSNNRVAAWSARGSPPISGTFRGCRHIGGNTHEPRSA